MEIIASHNNTDLDGLASMVAAKKLYPDAQLVFVGTLSRQCEEFMALHKDIFNVRRAEDIPFERVKKLVLVDTKDFSRIGSLKRLITDFDIEVHIFDHHPRKEEDIPAHFEIIEAVGAATTLLVELLKERRITLTSFEATVLTLGIYADTGNLTFTSTTGRDAEAVAFLLKQGARLSVISDFLGKSVTEAQKALFNTLLMSAEHYLINGVKILLTKASVEEYVAGLGILTNKLGDIEGVDLILSVVEMDDRVHVVARSRTDLVNVRSILQEFGGGGHEKAASATIKFKKLDEIVPELIGILKTHIKPAVTAENIMSTPVKSVFPHTTMEKAGKIMLRYGHSGLPVVEGLQLVGVISRRDVDKALQHDLGHAPVKGYMSRNVITTSLDTPLVEIQQLMIKNNIGRLPIVDRGRLIGIVSRTDVLKTLHGESYPEKYRKTYSKHCAIGDINKVDTLMATQLPSNIRSILEKISLFAQERKWSVYIVGGFVRDLLLGVENFDIDLVVEGDGIGFAQELSEFFMGKILAHESFGTAMVILPDGFKIDVATARVEYYEYPAALPQIEISSIKQDLYRRDFTINAMAISLKKDNYGHLIDYFCARQDLEQGIIRVLYNLSFVEDPTRLLRAVRFEQRYNFTMEPQTLELAKSAIKDNWLKKLSYERIREEIKHIYNENYPINAVNRMKELGLWRFILPEITIESSVISMIDRLPSINANLQQKVMESINFQPWLTYFIAMLSPLELEIANKVIERLKLTRNEKDIILRTLVEAPKVLDILVSEEYLKKSVIVKTLEDLPTETLAFILAKSQNLRITERIKLFLKLKKETKVSVTGNDLIELGIKPGPIFSEILAEIRERKLDGEINTFDEEIKYALELVKLKEE